MSGGFLTDFISWLFDDMMKYLLFTPLGIFNNPETISIVFRFGALSAAIVTLLSILEGIKRMLSLSYTPLRQMVVRYPLALAVTGFAPLAFYWTAMGVNKAVELIGALTKAGLSDTYTYANQIQALGDSIFMSGLTFFFLVAASFYMTKAFLQNGARWFGLLFNCVTTPLVMMGYIFKPYEHIAGAWLSDTMKKFGTQVVHSFYLSLIAVIMFSPKVVASSSLEDGFNAAIVRLMLAVGGLHLMMHPPGWIKGRVHAENAKTYIDTAVKLVKMMVVKK